MLTVKDILSNYPVKIEYNEHNIIRANLALDYLWEERCKERGFVYTGERSGSCKFAALLARNLFGGRLAGNHEHVFVISGSNLIDLNLDQKDVIDLHQAHLRMDTVLTHRDYRDALTSCLPRVDKWEQWVLNRAKK